MPTDEPVGPGPRDAVDSSAAGRPASPSPRRIPVRTCVGCRGRAGRADLVRVVAVDGVAVPDRAARLPGRGAWLHPDPDCLDLAERRRALPRALRVPAPLDVTALRTELATAGPAAAPSLSHHHRKSGAPQA